MHIHLHWRPDEDWWIQMKKESLSSTRTKVNVQWTLSKICIVKNLCIIIHVGVKERAGVIEQIKQQQKQQVAQILNLQFWYAWASMYKCCIIIQLRQTMTNLKWSPCQYWSEGLEGTGFHEGQGVLREKRFINWFSDKVG